MNHEWTSEHERGLTDAANANGVHPVQAELDEINRRGQLAKHVPPVREHGEVSLYESKQEALAELTEVLKSVAKPVLIGTALLSAAGTIVYVAVGFAIAAVSAATAWMAANTGIVAGVAAAGIGAMWAYLSVVSGGNDKSDNSGSGGGQTHNHYHQNNYFGSGPQNNK
jgi:hypothetical protein